MIVAKASTAFTMVAASKSNPNQKLVFFLLDYKKYY